MMDLIKSLFRSIIVAVITAVLFVAIFAFAAQRSQDSMANTELFGRIAFFLSVFAGCFTAARSVDNKPMVASLIFCAVYSFICFIVSIITGAELSQAWIMYLGALAMAIVGGALTLLRKPKKPKNLKKYTKYKGK